VSLIHSYFHFTILVHYINIINFYCNFTLFTIYNIFLSVSLYTFSLWNIIHTDLNLQWNPLKWTPAKAIKNISFEKLQGNVHKFLSQVKRFLSLMEHNQQFIQLKRLNPWTSYEECFFCYDAHITPFCWAFHLSNQ